MARTIRITLLMLLVGSVVVIAFGTVMPAGQHATPYLSALSNVTVSTAEAVSCNNLRCNANVCINTDFYGCGIQGGHCKSTRCFP
jgi:hypothetical protein